MGPQLTRGITARGCIPDRSGTTVGVTIGVGPAAVAVVAGLAVAAIHVSPSQGVWVWFPSGYPPIITLLLLTLLGLCPAELAQL